MRDSGFLQQIRINGCIFHVSSIKRAMGKEVRKRVELNSVQPLIEYLDSVLTSEVLLNIPHKGFLKLF